jgi:hypothetical protein
MSRIHLIIFAFAGFLCLAASAQTNVPGSDWKLPADHKKFHIFLLMGQSNMAGYGELEPGDEKPVPGVVAIPTVSKADSSKGDFQWQPAAHPLHNRLPSDRFGLGLPFAIAYRKTHPGVTVGLIPVAYGGAAINSLNKGTPVYQDAIEKAEWAKSQGVIAGVLWHQGESDTELPAQAEAYQKKLDTLVQDLRADLNLPDLPFVAGQLGDFYGTGPEHNAPDRIARIEVVQKALKELPERLPYTAWVSSAGLKSIDEHRVHFDRASYIEFGERYAKVFPVGK